MKTLLVSMITVCVLTIGTAKAQHAIRAARAINHAGQQVVVVDSIYDIKIYNDSTAVMDLGAKGDKATLNIVMNFNSKSRFDPETLKTFKQSLIEVTGLVVVVDDQPTMIIQDKEKIAFFSSSANQTWLALSNVSYRAH